jgi:hypothetical protein
MFKIYAYSSNDVTVHSEENKKFKLHQSVLESNEYFKAMFAANIAEGKQKAIHLPENARILEAVFCYIYIKEVIEVEESEWPELFIAASKYMVKGLEHEVVHRLIKMLCANNAIDMLLLSDQHPRENTTLYNSAFGFVMK